MAAEALALLWLCSGSALALLWLDSAMAGSGLDMMVATKIHDIWQWLLELCVELVWVVRIRRFLLFGYGNANVVCNSLYVQE